MGLARIDNKYAEDEEQRKQSIKEYDDLRAHLEEVNAMRRLLIVRQAGRP